MASIIEKAKDVLGMGEKVRYAIVGLGDISQARLMPGVKHTGNSEMVALVSGDPKKTQELCKMYDIKDSYSYEQFDQMIASKTVDAIYLGTPNWRHAEFAVPALKAGIHVLLEKPMEVNEAKCKEILDAQKSSGAKLLIAYRLHFDPATISAIERVRKGDLGQVHMFSSMFGQNVKPENHRVQNGVLAGPIYDIGIYPINAARNLFGAEPIEVSAVGLRHPESEFPKDFDDTVAITLVFPENKVAQCVVSFYCNMVDNYTIAGTKGSIHMSHAFLFSGLEFAPLVEGDKRTNVKFQDTDQFGGELKYFSDCILKNAEVEADGEEGWCDVRILEAVVKALETKSPQKLAPYTRSKWVTMAQEEKLRPVNPPKREVNPTAPAK